VGGLALGTGDKRHELGPNNPTGTGSRTENRQGSSKERFKIGTNRNRGVRNHRLSFEGDEAERDLRKHFNLRRKGTYECPGTSGRKKKRKIDECLQSLKSKPDALEALAKKSLHRTSSRMTDAE